ncbi:ankyrin repeat-containing domain protein [Xylaria cubensis]|nr:ankyrin repeat-containing domain protein [Xylaria cubensis]
MTSLHIAAIYGDEVLTRCFLEEGYDPNVVETTLRTPLYGAVQERLYSIVELLLDYGARIELASHGGLTALHAAIRGDPVLLELLLQRGGNCNCPDADGNTLLFYALAEKDEDALRILLNHGADPNIPNNTGLLPLFLSLAIEDTNFMGLLLDHGADPNARVGFGQSATVIDRIDADGSLQKGIINTLQPVSAGAQPHVVEISHSPISRAMQLGRTEALKRLLLSCENITWTDPINYGDGLMHYAVRLKNDEIFETLLVYGPEGLRSTVNNMGETPLHTAAQSGNITAASMLLNAGYDDIDHRDCAGSTPLTEALFYEWVGLAELLLAHGADRSIADEFVYGQLHGKAVMIHHGPRKETDPPELLALPRLSRLLKPSEST